MSFTTPAGVFIVVYQWTMVVGGPGTKLPPTPFLLEKSPAPGVFLGLFCSVLRRSERVFPQFRDIATVTQEPRTSSTRPRSQGQIQGRGGGGAGADPGAGGGSSPRTQSHCVETFSGTCSTKIMRIIFPGEGVSGGPFAPPPPLPDPPAPRNPQNFPLFPSLSSLRRKTEHFAQLKFIRMSGNWVGNSRKALKITRRANPMANDTCS